MTAKADSKAFDKWHKMRRSLDRETAREAFEVGMRHARSTSRVTDDQISKAARYLSDDTADVLNADKDDMWAIYGQDQIDLLRAALTAAGIV